MQTRFGIAILVFVGLAAALELVPALRRPAHAQAPAAAVSPTGTTEGAGSTIFGNTCESCHGNPKVPTAPNPAVLMKMTPERIYQALTTGDMVLMAQKLTDEQKRDIAEWVGGRPLGAIESGDASKMSNPCPTNPPIHDLTSEPSWNGWSPGLSNWRFQPAKEAGLSPAAVGRLKLNWAFGLPAAQSVTGQPTVVDGRVFVASDAGYLYSIDAKTGCVHWSFQAEGGIRSAAVIGPTKPGSEKYAAFFGDIRGNIYSVDATTGKLLWKIPIDPNPESRITGGTQLYEGRLYVPVASLEEPYSSSPNYRCCTFRGMVVALDSATGKQVWKTYTIPIPPTERTTPSGVTYWGPSAADVWGPLTIDPKREAVYFGTGNTFSAPDVGRSDAVMALNLDSGKLLWVKQVEAGDVWHTGCRGSVPPAGEGFPPRDAGQRPSSVVRRPNPNYKRPEMPASYYCPDPAGPDWDIAAGAMLVNLPDGKRLLVAGQKSGMAWGVGPDNDGALVWKSDISRGEIVFGGATDGEQAYYAFRSGGVAAIRVSDGLETWYTPITPQESMQNHYGFSAAVTAIPGVVFAAGLDGVLRAFDSFDGNQIWEYDTTPEVETVNGVKAHGGSIGSAGPTVSGGMVFVTSGYTGFQNGVPGNLLLAFGQR